MVVPLQSGGKRTSDFSITRRTTASDHLPSDLLETAGGMCCGEEKTEFAPL